MNDQPVYRHVQQGIWLRTLMLVLAAAMLLVILLCVRSRDPVAFAALPGLTFGFICLALSGIMFSTMTIQVTATDVRWWFGSGWPGGRIPRAELVGEEIANPGVLNGIGLHLTLSGWLWNVSLGPAIALRRNGKLATILGTDDPAGLLAALRG